MKLSTTIAFIPLRNGTSFRAEVGGATVSPSSVTARHRQPVSYSSLPTTTPTTQQNDGAMAVPSQATPRKE
eukprot:scaffold5469_cov175-Alexandrium_tamarense.AAC.4